MHRRDRTLPASLRFVLILLGFGACGAVVSGVVQYEETELQSRRAAEAMSGGNVIAGKRAVTAHGCDACHTIPGIAGAAGSVGPSLRGVATRAVIGGKQSNDPAHLIAWITSPEHLSPGTSMPNQPLTPQEGRDIAAYLYTLR